MEHRSAGKSGMSLAMAAVMMAIAGVGGAPSGPVAGEAEAMTVAAPGTVRLEAAPSLDTDPQGSLRIRALVRGPFAGEAARDLYAFNAVLVLAGEQVSFVEGSLRKGDFFDAPGGDWLVTAAAVPGQPGRVTIGGSRIGAIPGVSAPPGDRELFSLALTLGGATAVNLAWEEATFIDSQIRPVDAARFLGATLQEHPRARNQQPEEKP